MSALFMSWTGFSIFQPVFKMSVLLKAMIHCSATDECTCDVGCVMQVKSSDGAAQSAADSDESDDEPIVKKLKVG